MKYNVRILLPSFKEEFMSFTWWEFESEYMTHKINQFVAQTYPTCKYTRDKSGVIMYVDNMEIVHIEAE